MIYILTKNKRWIKNSNQVKDLEEYRDKCIYEDGKRRVNNKYEIKELKVPERQYTP